MIKRTFDFCSSLIGLLVLSPLLILFSIAIKISSSGPVFFLQKRVGKDGKLFTLIKFRSMIVEHDNISTATARGDARITKIGEFLRKYKLDELPELWNVLKGEMSIIGPRPERPDFTKEYEDLIPGYGRRHDIPPGITGLAQVSGHYHTDPSYKLGHDLQYLVNWSPILDLQILIRTIWVIFIGRT